MIDPNDPRLKGVTPEALAAELGRLGWKLGQVKKSGLRPCVREDSDAELFFASSAAYAEYPALVANAISVAAAFAEISEGDLLARLSRVPGDASVLRKLGKLQDQNARVPVSFESFVAGFGARR